MTLWLWVTNKFLLATSNHTLTKHDKHTMINSMTMSEVWKLKKTQGKNWVNAEKIAFFVITEMSVSKTCSFETVDLMKSAWKTENGFPNAKQKFRVVHITTLKFKI